MSFNRNKFKGASLGSLKSEKQEAEKKANATNPYQGRSNFHQIDQGKNVFRILPPHNPDEPPYRALRTTWLDCSVEKYEDGKPTGQTEIKKKRIFIATVHGLDIDGNQMKNDPVEAYINKAWSYANEVSSDKEDRKKFMAPILGYIGKDKKYVPGIAPSTNYVFYAVKDGSIGRLEIYKSIVDRMEEMNISADSGEDPIETDIFSDPDEGVSLIIEFDKGGERGKKYKVSKSEPGRKFKTIQEFYESERVPDSVLEELSKKESLTDLYVDAYTMRDFDLAIDGLRRFDEAKGYEIFKDKEFLQEIEQIKSIVKPYNAPSTEENKDTEAPKKTQRQKAEVKKEELSFEDQAMSLNAFECKKILNEYCLDNYGEKKELPKDLDTLREWVVFALKQEELPFEEDDHNTSEETTEEDYPQSEDDAPEVDEDDVAARLALLRKRV